MPVTAEQKKEMEEFVKALPRKRQQVSDQGLLDQCEQYLKQLLDLPHAAQQAQHQPAPHR